MACQTGARPLSRMATITRPSISGQKILDVASADVQTEVRKSLAKLKGSRRLNTYELRFPVAQGRLSRHMSRLFFGKDARR